MKLNLKNNKLLKYAFVLCALTILALLIDVNQFIRLMSNISASFFVAALLVVIFDQVFMGAKWNLLLRLYNVHVPFWVPVIAYLRGRVFIIVTPSILGIDAYKLYCIRKYYKQSAPIVSSIVVERSFGMLSSIAIVLLLLPFSIHGFDFAYKEYIGLISITGFIMLCLILHLIQTYAGMALYIRFPRFFPKKAHYLLENLVVNIAKLKHGRTIVWTYFFLSIGEKTFYGLSVYLSARALGLSEPGALLIITVAPIVALLERLPITVSAIGIREGLFVILFSPFYDDPTIPLAISLVLRAAEVVQVLISLLTWFIGSNTQVVEAELNAVETEYKKINKNGALTKER